MTSLRLVWGNFFVVSLVYKIIYTYQVYNIIDRYLYALTVFTVSLVAIYHQTVDFFAHFSLPPTPFPFW